MHEYAITKGIIKAVLEVLEEQNITAPVRSVHVTAGVCQGLIPESMQMFFDAEKQGTPLADAKLVITLQPMVARCPFCNVERELDEPILICPSCQGVMDMIKGRELAITAIEVEDEDDRA